jgi:hypothetical protein
MAYFGRYITAKEWIDLHAAYIQHGSSAGFWDTYQEIMEAATFRTGEPKLVANELLQAAVRLGAVKDPHYL